MFVKRLSSYEFLEVPRGNEYIPEDITGLFLRADRPIVVYSGHQCGNIPIDARYCDPLLQQVPPLPLVGTEYIMGPIMQRNDAGYTARVIVTQARTRIVLYIESGTVTLSYTNRRCRCTLRRIGDNPAYSVRCRYPLRVGQYLEFHVTPATSPLAVNCSSPCYVYQMNHGGTEQAIAVNTDPFMALVPPLGRFSTITRFSTTSSFTENTVLVFRNFVSVIAPRGHRMLLDGELLSADESLSVGEYVAYYKEIRHGFHEVRTQDGVATRIAVQVYGHGPSGTSYGGHAAYGLPADYFGECVFVLARVCVYVCVYDLVIALTQDVGCDNIEVINIKFVIILYLFVMFFNIVFAAKLAVLEIFLKHFYIFFQIIMFSCRLRQMIMTNTTSPSKYWTLLMRAIVKIQLNHLRNIVIMYFSGIFRSMFEINRTYKNIILHYFFKSTGSIAVACRRTVHRSVYTYYSAINVQILELWEYLQTFIFSFFKNYNF